LWLERNIHNATLCRGNSQAEVVEMFLKEKMEALAGLRPGLVGEVAKIPGSRILDGQFSAVQQAIGTAKKNVAGAAWLKKFVEDAKKSGDVAALLVKHGTVGRLSVAPLA
jgi:polar amino acid transport system substrate-binding protein